MILCAVAIIPMAKPSFIRAEQRLAPDLAADRTAGRGGGGSGATSRRRDIVFVVNPRGAREHRFELRDFMIPFVFLLNAELWC